MPESRRLRALTAGAVLALLVAAFSIDYTVEHGDTLSKIAKQHDVSLADLIEVNDVSNPNLIYPGQVLVIPGEEGEPDIIHVVVRGDTLSRIARAYGSSVAVLVESNGIANPNLIRIGEEFLVPGSSRGESNGGSAGGNQAPSDPNVRTGRNHVVRNGENLNDIAAQYKGVSAEQIARANGIINGKTFVGRRLFLDGPEFVAEGTESEITYRVKSGDRLGDIAAAHGATVSTLVNLNNIANANLIRIGQHLHLPAGHRWVCPVDTRSFSNTWGAPRGGGTRWHEGSDLFTKRGSPVYAPVSGTVEFKTGAIGGKQFNLFGDDGVEYIGSHMSDFGKSGEVNAGDILGFVGNTGNANGSSPHLHFGMYLEGGVVINPYPSLIANGCK